MLDKQSQWQKVYGYVMGNQATWLTNIGLRTGLFKAIHESEGGIHEAELAEKLGFKERYVQVWCRGAYAFELLEWGEATGYTLAPHLDSLLLDPTDPQFLGGRVQFFAALYEDYLAFPNYLESGEIWPRSEHDPFLLEALKRLTSADCHMITDHVLPQAEATLAKLEEGGTILDIGAGGGSHVVHYAQRFPNSKVVGLEYDEPSTRLAQKTLGEAGVSNAEVVHGDANQLGDRDKYDLITMNIALHETGGPDEFLNVLKRSKEALTEDGTVVVSELPYPDSPKAYRDSMIYKILAGVQLHEALVGCGMITQGQLKDLFKAAEFNNVRVAEQPVAARFVMLGER